MGEVYQAFNDRLGRRVAIKVLPARVSRNASALLRFEREAKALAALSLPNILSIFDVGRHGTAFAVTELLTGATLRQRLDRGKLPVATAIDVAAQVARGLAVAHTAGIVHRDLKPENLFLTAGGPVKILDFGIAFTVPRPGLGSAPLRLTAVFVTASTRSTFGRKASALEGAGLPRPHRFLGSDLSDDPGWRGVCLLPEKRPVHALPGRGL